MGSDSDSDSNADKKAKQTKPSKPDSKSNANEGSIFSKKNKGKAKKADQNKKRAMATAKKDSKLASNDLPEEKAFEAEPKEQSQAVLTEKDATNQKDDVPSQPQSRKESEPKMHQYVDGQIVPIDSLKDLKPEPKAVKQVPKPATNNSPLKNPDFTAFPDQPQKESKYAKVGL